MTSTTTAVMMPFISTFAKKYPDVNFEVRDGSTYTLYSYLMDGIIDISVARTPLQLNKVNSFTLCSEPMIAVSNFSANHQSSNAVPVTNNTATNSNSKMLSSKIIQLNDLSKHPLILYRRYERLILDTFHAKNLDPEIFCLCDDAKSALLWAKDGLATVSYRTRIFRCMPKIINIFLFLSVSSLILFFILATDFGGILNLHFPLYL